MVGSPSTRQQKFIYSADLQSEELCPANMPLRDTSMYVAPQKKGEPSREIEIDEREKKKRSLQPLYIMSSLKN